MVKKMNPFIIGVIIVGALMFINQGGSSFLGAVLPPGEFRANDDCTFITNIIEEPGFYYRERDGWISADAGTGMKGFGYAGYSSLMCGVASQLNVIPGVTTPEGFAVCTNPSYGDSRIYLGSPGRAFFRDDKPEASQAILSCGSTCTDTSWSPSTSTVCSGTQFTQASNCGNERNAVGTMDCSVPPVCGDGVCDPGEICPADCGSSCPTMAEVTSCRVLGDSELLMAASNWLSG